MKAILEIAIIFIKFDIYSPFVIILAGKKGLACYTGFLVEPGN